MDSVRPLRGVAFAAILCAMLVQPFARQALGMRTRWLRDWAMMGGVGEGIVDARFFAVARESRRPLDRHAVLASHGLIDAYRPALFSESEVHDAARLLCDALGPTADVRVIARQSHRTGWTTILEGQENLCVR